MNELIAPKPGLHKILAQIGKDDFATVHRAHNLDLDRQIAQAKY